MKKQLFTLLVIVTLIQSGCESGVIVVDPVTESAGADIIGGEETNYESWQGVIYITNGFMSCTGTLIHPEVVLSAGHCVKLKEYGFTFDMAAMPGLVQIKGGARGEKFYARAKKIVSHPTWKGELSDDAADISLILLRKPITDVPIYRLRDFPMPENGDPGIIVGYGGNTSETPPGGSGLHRAGETTLLNVLPRLIETGEWSNTCQGDSGGPLFSKQNGEWTVTGVTSFGIGACYPENGSYSVNLLAFCAWLNETMTELVGEDLGLEGCESCQGGTVDEWGQPCGDTYGCCPPGTACRFPEDFSNGTLGFCAPTCCALGLPDAEYCTDMGPGTESCAFSDDTGEAFCAIHCDGDEQCPEGTTCRNKPFETESICIATEEGPGGETDCDVDGDADADTDADGDADADTDAGGDADADIDAGAPLDGGDAEVETAGCGCATVGVPANSVSNRALGALVSLLP